MWSGTELQIVGVRDGIATPIAKDGLFPVWMPDSSAVLFSRRTAERAQVNRDGTRLLATIVTPRPAGTTASSATPTLQLTVHANLAGAGRR